MKYKIALMQSAALAAVAANTSFAFAGTSDTKLFVFMSGNVPILGRISTDDVKLLSSLASVIAYTDDKISLIAKAGADVLAMAAHDPQTLLWGMTDINSVELSSIFEPMVADDIELLLNLQPGEIHTATDFKVADGLLSITAAGPDSKVFENRFAGKAVPIDELRTYYHATTPVVREQAQGGATLVTEAAPATPAE